MTECIEQTQDLLCVRILRDLIKVSEKDPETCKDLQLLIDFLESPEDTETTTSEIPIPTLFEIPLKHPQYTEACVLVAEYITPMIEI